MVDYSKWDKLEVSDSDDEPTATEDGFADHAGSDDDESFFAPPLSSAPTASAAASTTGERTTPGVYRVGVGESVTIPGRNVTITSSPGSAAAAAASPQKALSAAPSTQRDRLTRNGGETLRYWWAQDADRVVVSFFCPSATAARDVRVSTDSERGLSVALADGTVLAQGELFGPLDLDVAAPVNAGADVPGLEDWEMLNVVDACCEERATIAPVVATDPATAAAVGEDMVAPATAPLTVATSPPAPALPPQRLLSLTLRKKPLGGMVLWWRTVLKGDPEVDAMALRDRSSEQRTRAEAFQKVYADATAQFKQRVKERREQGGPEPIAIDEP